MRPLIFFSLIPSLLFMSCQTTLLNVQTEYLSHENLASFRVGTPDPLLRNPPLGQKLIVNWSIPQWDPDALYELNVSIRFKDGTIVQKQMILNQMKGTYIYSLLNEEYFTHQGFKTYFAQLTLNGEVLEEWKHQLWANVIEIPEIQGQDEEADEEDQTDQEIYDEHYRGEGGIQKPIDDITEPNQAEYKYFF